MRSPQSVGADINAASKQIDDAKAARQAAKAEAIEIGRTHPLSRVDFESMGLTRTEGRKIDEDLAREPFVWETDATYCVEREWAGSAGTDIVAVVPSDTTAMTGMEFGVYMRAPRLKQRLNDAIAYVGTDRSQRLDMVRPVLARFTLGYQGVENPCLPERYRAILKSYLDELRGTAGWGGGADAIFLGDAIDLDVPLGFANRGGIPGVRHVRLDDLRSHGQLKGVPTAS